jgi:ABC-2 type transport system permease protein
VAAAATARVELRRWVRQPQAVAAALVAPVAVASLVSLALGGEPTIDGTVAVVDLDRGPAATAFVEDALGEPRVTEVLAVREVDDRAEAARLVEDGSVAAAVVLPAGMTEGIAAGTARPEVVRPDEPSIGADVAELVAEVFATRARATGAALAATGRPLPAAPGLEVAPVAPGGRALDAATHFGPAIGLFFVMLALGFAVDGHVADRRRGLVDRVAATPASPAAVAAGRALAALAIGCLSLAVTAVTMQLAFGRGWGPTTSVAALAVAVAVAFAGLAATVAAVVRTPGQAQGLTVALAFGMALASGSFTPPGTSTGRPPLAELLPTTMALDGFALTTTEAAGLGALAPMLGGLVAVGVAGFLATAALATRSAR